MTNKFNIDDLESMEKIDFIIERFKNRYGREPIKVVVEFRNFNLNKLLTEGFKYCSWCGYLIKTDEDFCCLCGRKMRTRTRLKNKKREIFFSVPIMNNGGK